MGITAKKLASILQLSQTAVSMALHNQPGVSTETRKRVIETAEEYGYDFSKLKKDDELIGTIYVVHFIANNAILSYSPIFSDIENGIEKVAKESHLKMKSIQIREKFDDLDRFLEDLPLSDCLGIILIGTEASKAVCRKFNSSRLPFVLLDTYFEDIDCDSVLINNEAGSFLATDYLIQKRGKQPGYLSSSYRIPNFDERLVGYKKAIRKNGYSLSRSLIHEVSPNFEGAYGDVKELIEEGGQLASCYVCDNDIIAIGAIKAFKEKGFRVPEDISIVGFDGILESGIVEPNLTTMNVPRFFMGEEAAKQLISKLKSKAPHSIRISILPNLLERDSVGETTKEIK